MFHHGDRLNAVVHGFQLLFSINVNINLKKSTFIVELYYQVGFTHKEFDLVTGASSAEESVDIVQTSAADIGITQQRWRITLI